MSVKHIYRLILNGKEYTGTKDEISKLCGYSEVSIGMIARGEINSRSGVSIECIGRQISNRSDKFDPRLLAEWDNVVAKFKGIEWVREKTDKVIKLKVGKK